MLIITCPDHAHAQCPGCGCGCHLAAGRVRRSREPQSQVLAGLDPTGLQPGDVVVGVGEHEEDGCHCDVTVTVRRAIALAEEEA